MGTQLLARGMKAGVISESMNVDHPEIVKGIHSDYIDAGADIIITNTFGSAKTVPEGFDMDAATVAGFKCAREVADEKGALVALNVGPTGELLEPGGVMTVDEAYERFAHVMRLGADICDLVLIETMADLLEAKTAFLAAREHTDLPVVISMTFEENGRTFAGVPVEAFGITIGAMRPDAIGLNCSAGPVGMIPLAKRLAAVVDVPVFMKPNAGLPDPITGEHVLGPEGFAAEMEGAKEAGLCMVGGCCGTSPAHIALLTAGFRGEVPKPIAKTEGSRLASSTRVFTAGGADVTGERINPTGNLALKNSMGKGDLGKVQALAVEQASCGADILDINAGVPGADEKKLLVSAVKAVQAVSDLPVQIDSADPEAIEAALRAVNGKPIVNSTTGEKDKLGQILPLCAKYGAAVVGLTLDEGGIPETAEGRFAVAEKICDAAAMHGIPKEDIYIDCLTLAAGAVQGAATATLEALRLVKERLGVRTVLGVSNISFGLPNRALLNRQFLTLALGAGLDLAIVNPSEPGLMEAIRSFRLLSGTDGEMEAYIEKYAGAEDVAEAREPGGLSAGEGEPLESAILKGLKDAAVEAARGLLAETEPLDVIDSHLMPALDRVGEGYEKGTIYLPQLLSSAGAAQAAFDVVKEVLAARGEEGGGEPVVIATVKGDVHDIGKNIVKVLLQNYGFSVIDLGRDVPPEKVVEAARDSGARLIGLSALMTTTLPAMAETIAAAKEAGLDCKVMVGGAVVTQEYADSIGADFYGKDASSSAQYARSVFGA
ncbi:MAG: homocysteine S-methyltransferase family protein [Clostridiales Family XIII bacterium]|nr:homocysteine S-methyltransferase family protein [Clostridiales Family XIII bacterium]